MLKFKDLTDVCREYLLQQLNNVSVEAGKYGEMPSIAPCIWIYAEPTRNTITAANYLPAIRRAKVTFFAIVNSGLNKTDAANQSIELIELVEEKIFSEQFDNFLNQHPKNVNQNITVINYTDSEQPLNFDAIYSDFAVSYLEVWMDYSR